VEPDMCPTGTAVGNDQRQGSDKIITAYFLNCMHNNLLSYDDSNLMSIITTQRGYAHIQLFKVFNRMDYCGSTYARISSRGRGQFTILKKISWTPNLPIKENVRNKQRTSYHLGGV